MPPSLATYQQAANAVYEPQKAAEQATLTTQENTQLASQEALKPQVQTDYQAAIDSLTQTTNQNVAKINQLYTERLGGNFSGLQGNDLGQMFSSANRVQGTIEATRANKLASIATEEANIKATVGTEIGNLGSKYSSLEAQYSQKEYGDAVKQYNEQQQRSFQNQIELSRLGIEQSRLGLDYSKAARAASTDLAKGFKVKQLSSGNKSYVGPNGQTNLYQYASAVAGGDPNATYAEIVRQLASGSATDKLKAHFLVGQKLNPQQGIAYLQKHAAYVFQ